MTFSPRPCASCGHTEIGILPNIKLDFGVASTAFGITATKKPGGVFWTVTLAVCTRCGLTQAFTTNAQELSTHTPDAYIATAHER